METPKEGTVRYVNPSRGFAFAELNGEDVYIHFSNLLCDKSQIVVGAKVSFELAPPHRIQYKPQAVNVCVVDDSNGGRCSSFADGFGGKVDGQGGAQ